MNTEEEESNKLLNLISSLDTKEVRKKASDEKIFKSSQEEEDENSIERIEGSSMPQSEEPLHTD